MGLFIEAPDIFEHTGFTGTRHGMTNEQARSLEEQMRGLVGWWHHGDCLGADWQTHQIARQLGLRIEVHPPLSKRLRAYCKGDATRPPKEFLARNRDIVRYTSKLIAAPFTMSEEKRGGTWATVRFARHLRRPVMIVFPDGSVRAEGCIA